MPDREQDAEAGGPEHSSATSALAALSDLPPLALMAVVAALFELTLARGIWHGFADILDSLELIEIRRWARFPRNLAAVSGVVALVASTLTFLRVPGYAAIGRRLATAAFSGIFIPSVVVATALPHAALRRRLVIFGLAAANVLVTMIAMTAARYRGPRPVRVATVATALTCFVCLLVVGLGQLAQGDTAGPLSGLSTLLAHHPTRTQSALLFIRHLGEVCWFTALVASAGAAATGGDRAGLHSRALRFGAFVLVVAVAIIGMRYGVGHRFRLLLFGAFRFGLFVDNASWVYALPLAAGLAGGLLGLFREGPRRQLACGALLWLAGGFAPHTPIQLLYLVLGAMLLTRSAQALDPVGPWRANNPWGRFGVT